MRKVEKLVWGIIALIILSIGFLSGSGYEMYHDSTEYIQGWRYLPALYPTFLKLLRFIFGEQYLIVTIVVQTVFAVVSIVILVDVIIRTFELQRFFEHVIVFGGVILTFFVDNLDIFHKGFGTCNAWILTEGLSYPLFLLSVAMCMLFLRNRDGERRYYFLVIFLVFLALCRTQMYACWGMVVLILLYRMHFQKVNWRIIGKQFFLLVISIVITICLQRVYEINAYGVENHPFNQCSSAGHLMYIAHEEDAEGIDSAEEKELFLKIYKMVRENNWHIDDTDGSWFERENGYIYNYNPIVSLILNEAYSYVGESGWSGEQADVMVYEIMGRFISAMEHHTGEWIALAILQYPMTLSGTIFGYKLSAAKVAIAFSATMMFVYLILLFYLFIKNKRLTRETLFASLLLIYMVGSGVATTFAIRSLGRYMFYCCGLFYISMFLMMRAGWRLRNAEE